MSRKREQEQPTRRAGARPHCYLGVALAARPCCIRPQVLEQAVTGHHEPKRWRPGQNSCSPASPQGTQLYVQTRSHAEGERQCATQ